MTTPTSAAAAAALDAGTTGSPRYYVSRTKLALIALFSFTILTSAVGPTRSLTHHEVMFAQPAKEMLATGDFALPRFSEIPCTHKPPGTNWMIAGAMAITGSQAEWIVRLPTAMAGAVAAVLVAMLAARWFGSLIGVVAGLMHATVYYVLQFGRLAEADMPLVASVTATMLVFAMATVDSPRGRFERRWTPWLFYACLGLAFQFKGLIGPIFVMGGCGLYAVITRDRAAWRILLNPIGIGIFALCSAGWLAVVCITHPAFFADQIMEHFGRFRGELDGRKDPFYYFYQISLILLPWTPFCLAGLVWALRKRELPAQLRAFVVCWIVPGLIVLSLSHFKSKHYPAPLMPPLLMIGAAAMVGFYRYRQTRSVAAHLFAAGAGVVGAVIAIAALSVAQPEGYVTMIALVGAMLATQLAMVAFEYRRNLTAELATLFGGAWVIIIVALGLVTKYHDSYRDPTLLAAQANQIVPADETLYVVDLLENQITYYLDRPVVRIDDQDEFATRAETAPTELFILGPENLESTLASLGQIETLERCASLRRYQTPDERLTLFRFEPEQLRTAGQQRDVQ